MAKEKPITISKFSIYKTKGKFKSSFEESLGMNMGDKGLVVASTTAEVGGPLEVGPS